jgi:UDP-2,3-diacylglucosamine hydrolase
VTTDTRPSEAPIAPAVRASEWTAPGHWKSIDFISDLHLGPETPRTFEAWRQHLEHSPADCIVMLGDWFEVWVGDDLRDQGVAAQCVETLARVSKVKTVAFMAGNRDFILGADMLAACGMRGLDDPTVMEAFGERVLLTHGDALCLSDVAYQKFRLMVRNPAWLKQALALPQAERLRIGAQMRTQSETQQNGRSSPADWADVDFPAAMQWMEAARAPTMIHGHTHRPGTETMAPGYVRHVLSDWDLDHAPYRAEVLRWSAAGLHRVAPASGP